jgi:hypothetical protein
VARQYNVPLETGDPISHELTCRGLRLEVFHPGDRQPPYDQGMRLLTHDGLVVSEAISQHVRLSTIHALRDLCELERTDVNGDWLPER